VLVRRSLDHSAAGHRLEEVTRPIDAYDPLARTGSRSRAANDLFDGLPRLDVMRRLEQYMWQAGMYQGANRALLLMGGLFAVTTVGGTLATGDLFISTGVGVALGLTPLIYIRIKRVRRLKAFLLQLPFALD
jgi:Flp pilus assembly protein TadB